MVRPFAVALIACAALAGCGGHRSAAACPGARLALAEGSAASEATGQHTLLVEIRNRGVLCTIEGVPKVALLDRAGRTLDFSYSRAGDLMIPPAHPRPVRVAPGRPGLVVLNKYRCDIRAVAVARRVRLTLPGLAPRTLELQRPGPALDWCPAERASSTVDVSAVLAAGPQISSDGRAVLDDVYDGHLDERWSCGSLRAAIARLPVDGPIYSTLALTLDRAAARECAEALRAIRPGAERDVIGRSLGKPTTPGPRCEVWRWPPAGGALDGARICFRSARAALVQRAVHG